MRAYRVRACRDGVGERGYIYKGAWVTTYRG